MPSSRASSLRSALLTISLATSLALPGCATPQAVTAPRGPATSRPSVCHAKRGLVLSVPALDLVCRHRDHFSGGSCQGQVAITLTNCGPTRLTVDHITMRELRNAPYTSIATFRLAKPTLQPGERRQRVSTHLRAGRYQITVQLVGVTSTPTATLIVRNPTLEAARSRCRACKGDFGPHGMGGVVSCSCRMPDAGKPCSDGDQCKGKCIGTPQGFRCSKHRTVFGCHSYLPRGWSRRPKPAAGGLAQRLPHICVD